MTMTRPVSKPAKSGITFLCWCILAWGAAVMFGWLPNPADRFFEAGPQTYRNYADVLVASGSPRLRHGIKDALEKDGKLTQANLKALWPVYEQALPDGFRFADASSTRDTATERQHLMELVGAHPQP